MNNSVVSGNGRATVLALLGAARGVEQRIEAALGEHGLSMARLGTMTNLAASPEPLTLGELADRASCVRSNVTQLVDRLEADGLVRRVPDPGDRRVIRAELSDRGRALQKVGERVMREVEESVLSGLDPDQASALRQALTRLG